MSYLGNNTYLCINSQADNVQRDATEPNSKFIATFNQLQSMIGRQQLDVALWKMSVNVGPSPNNANAIDHLGVLVTTNIISSQTYYGNVKIPLLASFQASQVNQKQDFDFSGNPKWHKMLPSVTAIDITLNSEALGQAGALSTLHSTHSPSKDNSTELILAFRPSQSTPQSRMS